jgi:hypothetical protein
MDEPDMSAAIMFWSTFSPISGTSSLKGKEQHMKLDLQTNIVCIFEVTLENSFITGFNVACMNSLFHEFSFEQEE